MIGKILFVSFMLTFLYIIFGIAFYGLSFNSWADFYPVATLKSEIDIDETDITVE